MSESRQELLSWLNQVWALPKLNNAEKVATQLAYYGYLTALASAIAQVFDSIYGDVPLKRIDFAANAEYKYLQNWKVLQTHFLKHKIDKVIPVEKLAKCKMQDNLEFLQWCKKYWDQYYPGGEYDAVGRRGGHVAAAPTAVASSNPARVSRVSAAPISAPARRAVGASTATVRTRMVSSSNSQNTALQEQIDELTDTVTGLEKERDFYFNKLRDIEILTTETPVAGQENGGAREEGSLVKQIQEVLYSTEEGFEVPDTTEVVQGGVEELALSAGEEDAAEEDEVF